MERINKLKLKYTRHLKKTEFIEANPSEVYEYLVTSNFGILLRDNNLINNVASPLKFAEYLSAGLPVVVSSGVGDTEEIIENYNVGSIVRNNDYKSAASRINELLSDRDIGKKCMTVARKEFDIIQSQIKYEKIYKDLLN